MYVYTYVFKEKENSGRMTSFFIHYFLTVFNEHTLPLHSEKYGYLHLEKYIFFNVYLGFKVL